MPQARPQIEKELSLQLWRLRAWAKAEVGATDHKARAAETDEVHQEILRLVLGYVPEGWKS